MRFTQKRLLFGQKCLFLAKNGHFWAKLGFFENGPISKPPLPEKLGAFFSERVKRAIFRCPGILEKGIFHMKSQKPENYSRLRPIFLRFGTFQKIENPVLGVFWGNTLKKAYFCPFLAIFTPFLTILLKNE